MRLVCGRRRCVGAAPAAHCLYLYLDGASLGRHCLHGSRRAKARQLLQLDDCSAVVGVPVALEPEQMPPAMQTIVDLRNDFYATSRDVENKWRFIPIAGKALPGAITSEQARPFQKALRSAARVGFCIVVPCIAAVLHAAYPS